MEFEDLESDVCKTGNEDCGYIILPNNLCGCNPGKYGGYMDCDKNNCPIKKQDDYWSNKFYEDYM